MKNRKEFENYINEYLLNKNRIEPRCKHFGLCGGCKYQDYSYEDQLEAKHSALKSLFSDYINNIDYDIGGSPNEFGYRVKMEYVLSADKFGLRKTRRFREVVNLSECHLISGKDFKRIKRVYNFATSELGITPFDLENGSGSLRYFVIKSTENDNMLNVVTSNEFDINKLDLLAQYILDIGFVSVNHIPVNAEKDTTFGQVNKTWGKEYIDLEIKDRKYLIGANTFSQNNISAFEDLLSYVESYIGGAKNLLDLYCGVGTISLQFADKVEHVLGVEEVSESIDLAKRNAEINQISNVEFVAQDVKDFLRNDKYSEFDYGSRSNLETKFETGNKHYDTVIADPPRSGMQGKVCRRISKYFSPERIIYISCNPITQKEDLVRLSGNYSIVDMRAFDLFPQTNHVENVIILDKCR